jgi:hypothetical protein
METLACLLKKILPILKYKNTVRLYKVFLGIMLTRFLASFVKYKAFGGYAIIFKKPSHKLLKNTLKL